MAQLQGRSNETYKAPGATLLAHPPPHTPVGNLNPSRSKRSESQKGTSRASQSILAALPPVICRVSSETGGGTWSKPLSLEALTAPMSDSGLSGSSACLQSVAAAHLLQAISDGSGEHIVLGRNRSSKTRLKLVGVHYAPDHHCELVLSVVSAAGPMIHRVDLCMATQMCGRSADSALSRYDGADPRACL